MKQKKDYPGTVFVRNNKIYVSHKNRQHRTGLDNTPENIEKVKKELKQQYLDFLTRSGQLPLSGSNKSISFLFSQFVDHQISRGRMKKTMYAYKNSFYAIISSDIDFTEGDITVAVEKMIQRKDLSPTSKNIYLRHFQVFLNWVIDNYNLNTPGLKKVFRKYRYTVSDKIVEPYTEQELELLINTVNKIDREFALLLLFMRYSGFRITETLNLTWEDIDFRHNVIIVPNKIHKQLLEQFPISGIIHSILAELKTYRSEGKLFRWQSSSKSSLNRFLKKIEIQYGIKVAGQCFHRFRNTFSNEILTNTRLTIPEMSDLMRHKSINTTFKLYHRANYNALGKKLDEIYPKNIKSFKGTSKDFTRKQPKTSQNEKQMSKIKA